MIGGGQLGMAAAPHLPPHTWRKRRKVGSQAAPRKRKPLALHLRGRLSLRSQRLNLSLQLRCCPPASQLTLRNRARRPKEQRGGQALPALDEAAGAG